MFNKKTKLKLTDFESNLLWGRNERIAKQSYILFTGFVEILL